MKYINIDAEFMIEHGLTLEQAAFFSYLRESLSWSQDVIVDNISYKWVSRGKVVLDIPYITSKPDTVYRWFNKLSELGLITYLKKEGKDLYRLNEVCKGWNSRLNSDGNPNKLGWQSENDSDGNPTYSNTNINSIYIKETYPSLVSFYNNLFKRNTRGCKKSQSQYRARVKEGYKLEDFQKALTALHQDKYHQEKDYFYATLEFITRSDKLERFVNMTSNAQLTKAETDEQRYEGLMQIIIQKPMDNNRFTQQEREFICAFQRSYDRFPPDNRKLVSPLSSLTRAELDQMEGNVNG